MAEMVREKAAARTALARAERLERENARLVDKPARAEATLEVMGKLRALMEMVSRGFGPLVVEARTETRERPRERRPRARHEAKRKPHPAARRPNEIWTWDVTNLPSDPGIIKSRSRPKVSNDNLYSEAQFKTVKCCPVFPDEFGSPEDARSFWVEFFEC
ncbi:hypothetical protein [Streptosporangium sp. NPDC006007]|uniref:hypothetical protein n=1 Tax=Streptosporangium sp. NPDC006007 TaxID=3154575 RepID=UPI0033AEE992